MTEAKVAAKLHGCLDVIQTADALSSEEQSFGEKLEASTVCKDSNANKPKQQDTTSICAKDVVHDNSKSSVNSEYTEEDKETIASFWRKHRKDKITTPEIDQSLPLRRPQLVTPEMQLSPQPPKLSLQDGNQDHMLTSFNWNKNLNPTSKEPNGINFKYLPKTSNNNSSSISPKKRKMIDELNETIYEMNAIHQTQTNSTHLSFLPERNEASLVH